jgi:hypothetical protein
MNASAVIVQLLEWSETWAEELADVLMKLLQDESAVMRLGSANVIAASVVKADLTPSKDGVPFLSPSKPKDDGVIDLLPSALPEKQPKPKAPPEKSKVALCLEKRSVRERLNKLREDAEPSVRKAAGTALERLASIPEKKP